MKAKIVGITLLFSSLIPVVYSAAQGIAHPAPAMALGVMLLVMGTAVCVYLAVRETVSRHMKLGGVLLPITGTIFYVLLIAGFWAIGRYDVLWVPDSFTLHGPGAERAVAFLKGNGRLDFTSVFGEQVQFTYLWAALLGVFAGINPVSTAISNLAIKLITWILWHRSISKHYGNQVANVTLLILMFVPTQVFYGLVYYKEPVVQLFVVIALGSALDLRSKPNAQAFTFGAVSVLCLAIERIYLAPMLGLVLVVSIIPHIKSFAFTGRSIASGVVAICAAGVFVVVFFRDFSLLKIFDNLAWLRHNYMNAPGVDKAWNQDIAYPLAVIKILFTPFFHPNKLEVFKDFSAILTWGAIPSQVVTFLALFGVSIEFLRARLRTAILTIPFILFLVLFAYLAPYSGRQRDSFYPVIALFAAIGILKILKTKPTQLAVS
ncbi:MAG: hypothetical protein J0L82_06050 [Deltaproteobacteria bacterium]|nr:hypothetical protein [Deltaproteobacteria bacterium]